MSKGTNMLLLFLVCFFSCTKTSETAVSDPDEIINDPAPKEEYDTLRCTFDLGIHDVNLHWNQDYQTALDQMKDLKAKTVRLGYKTTPKQENTTINLILYANSIGLNVTLLIPVAGLPSSCYEKGTEISAGNSEKEFWPSYPLSKIDLDAYENWVSTFLYKCKMAGAKIETLEMGNEIMWAAFNGDLPIEGGIVYDSSFSWSDMPQYVKEGIRKCGELSVTTKTVCQRIFWEETPEVVFGSVNLLENYNYYRSTGGCIVHPATVIAIASGKYPGMPEDSPNYIEELDGYAVHFYPDFEYSDYPTMVRSSLDYLSWFMDGIMEYTSKPVCVTEFGFSYWKDGLGSDGIRLNKYKAFLEAMDMTSSKYHWKQAHIYSWDDPGYGLFINGQLTTAGKYIIDVYYRNQRNDYE